MDGVRPSMTSLENFATAARPRLDQVGAQEEGLCRLEGMARTTASRLTELEATAEEARAPMERPRLSLGELPRTGRILERTNGPVAPSLGDMYTTPATVFFPNAPVAPTTPPTPYQHQVQTTLGTVAPTAAQASTPAGGLTTTHITPYRAQNGMRPLEWAVKLGPINLNEASVTDALRAMFTPRAGGAGVLKELIDPILTDNLDRITGKCRTRSAAHKLVRFWKDARRDPYMSVEAQVLHLGNEMGSVKLLPLTRKIV